MIREKFAPCLLVPIYNHKREIKKVIDSLKYLEIRCLIIDDGSDEPTKKVLREISEKEPWVDLVVCSENRGKGVALRTGFRLAAEKGFSHTVVLDADGQHNAIDVPRFIAAAKQNPLAMVYGEPVFDESAPKVRLYGRKITTYLVWLQTLSNEIRDALCGFRCYPLASVIPLIDSKEMGDRMDFETEIAVLLYWLGVPTISVKTEVRYQEENGLSNFNYLSDNLLIFRLHVKMILGMLPKSPGLILRTLRKNR